MTSAGLLMFRRRSGVVEVLLVHPGGPFWARKDEGAWSIPKGEHAPDADPLEAARREFEEETGSPVSGQFLALTPVRLPGGKRIRAWAVEGDLDADRIRSNTFTLEWPPRSGRHREYPEVDRAAWFPLAEAAVKVNAGQRPLLSELQRLLDAAPAP